MTVYDILMIDDDEDNYHSLKNYASGKSVVLQYSRTLQEGMEKLESNKRILGVILDGKGLLHKSQSDSEATGAFVHEALTQIKLLEEKRGKTYPKCVLTAWYDNLKESLEPRGIKVFDKKKLAINEDQKEELFHYLMVQATDSTEYTIRSKYQAIFQFMDSNYMPDKADNAFYDCCLKVENGNPSSSDFNTIRKLYEMIIIGIHEKDKMLLPDKVFKGAGRPNLDWSLRYLGGWEIKERGIVIFDSAPARVPAHIHDCATFIKEISSAFSHDNHDKFTTYSYTSALFAWIELFLWYTGWVDNLKLKLVIP